MKEKFIKYFLTTILIIQFIIIGYLSIYFLSNDNIKEYSDIIITGNKLLPAENYLQLIKSEEVIEENSLHFIKTKIESHQYVLKADVSINRENVIEIHLQEKKMYSMIRNYENQFITNDFEFIKIVPQTIIPPIPLLIFNENMDSNQKNEKIKSAFMIIDSLGELDNELSEKLTEINLSNKKHIVLLFRDLNAPVIINKSNLIKEIITFSEFMNSENSKVFDEGIKYIDLRFNNQIIIG